MALRKSTGFRQHEMGFSPTGAIGGVADGGGGKVEVTALAHGLQNQSIVTNIGTSDHNGLFTISNRLTNTFEIIDTFVTSAGQTGTWTVTGRNIQDLLSLGEIKIYSGAAPADADTAVAGTLLVTIDNGGVGILLGEPTAGVIGIKSGETWSGVAVAAGAASYFRYVIKGIDTGASSTTEIRLQGSVGTSAGSDLVIPSTTISIGATQTVDQFDLTTPAV